MWGSASGGRRLAPTDGRDDNEREYEMNAGRSVPDAATSARMRRTRQRDTAAELVLRRELHRRGLRYFVDCPPQKDCRRRADILFPRARVAIFVDGCFWHGCPIHATWPKTNAEWWRQKIERNRARDRATDEALRNAGWTVVRVWEHEEAKAAANRVERVVRCAMAPSKDRAKRRVVGPRLAELAEEMTEVCLRVDWKQVFWKVDGQRLVDERRPRSKSLDLLDLAPPTCLRKFERADEPSRIAFHASSTVSYSFSLNHHSPCLLGSR